MALYYELPVYRDVYKLILMIFECTKDFSKEYKYTLGRDILELGWECLDLVLEINASPNNEKHLKILKMQILK